MKNEKNYVSFSFYVNIGNFEAFLWNLNLSGNHLFWRCAAINCATTTVELFRDTYF